MTNLIVPLLTKFFFSTSGKISSFMFRHPVKCFIVLFIFNQWRYTEISYMMKLMRLNFSSVKSSKTTTESLLEQSLFIPKLRRTVRQTSAFCHSCILASCYLPNFQVSGYLYRLKMTNRSNNKPLTFLVLNCSSQFKSFWTPRVFFINLTIQPTSLKLL